jgi:hypothetical protein
MQGVLTVRHPTLLLQQSLYAMLANRRKPPDVQWRKHYSVKFLTAIRYQQIVAEQNVPFTQHNFGQVSSPLDSHGLELRPFLHCRYERNNK